jgi:hypothetical protein
MKKSKKEQIEDLKKALALIAKAYFLQNECDIILFENFDIDEDCKFLDDDFYKIKDINSSTNLYKKEIAILNLLKKLEL